MLLQVVLFAVKKAYQKQGVARNLERDLFRYCSKKGIGELAILSEKRANESRNWWVLRGGFDPASGPALALTNFAVLKRHLVQRRGEQPCTSVPSSFLLPWHIHADAAEERAAEAEARRKAVHDGLAESERQVSPDQLARCGFNLITVLMVPVPQWCALHDTQAPRHDEVADDDGDDDGEVAEEDEEEGEEDDEEEGEEEDEEEEDEEEMAEPEADEADTYGGEDAEEDAEEGEEAAAAAPAARPAAVAARHSGRQRPARRASAAAAPNMRKLRVGEFMMGSGVFTKKMVAYGMDVLGIERDVSAPAYDGAALVRPAATVKPGEAAAMMREAHVSPDRSPARTYLEICQCRDILPEDLPTLDCEPHSARASCVGKTRLALCSPSSPCPERCVPALCQMRTSRLNAHPSPRLRAAHTSVRTTIGSSAPMIAAASII